MQDEPHANLTITQNYVYKPCEFNYSKPISESESKEYGAYQFELNNALVLFRVAKTTPAKIGQFVTLWKRIANGPIQPYDSSDPVDLFVICTEKDAYFGQFVFPKSVLCEQDIVSVNGKGGKRAIRIYAPWDKPTNRQAQKTKKWQLQYFLEIPKNECIDKDRAHQLYKQANHPKC